MHWAARYVGIPYEPAGRGPDRVDCWGLVRLIYLQEFGLELPLHPGVSLEDNPRLARDLIQNGLMDWTESERPFDGALVAMGHRNDVYHVGVYADVASGYVLHCWHASRTSVAEHLKSLRMRGMQTQRFYQHVLWPSSSKPQILSSPSTS